MDFKLFEVWMTKPGGRVTTDAKKVMPTSNANFLEGCMANSFILILRTPLVSGHSNKCDQENALYSR